MLLVVGYFLKYDQKFLASRMQMKEKETTQKWVVAVSFLLFILGFLVPGLDFRFGWSKVPAWQVVSADVLVLASYFYCFLVFRENSFASRIVEVKKGQKVISTGPYSHVRHPMYTAITVMYMVTPLALGSYWGMIPMLSIPALLIVRLLNEEKVLRKKLPGYSGYCRKVRYRLIPGVW
jgi:protein-S-isoprenylcysteine O-methyltransferase Ste14